MENRNFPLYSVDSARARSVVSMDSAESGLVERERERALNKQFYIYSNVTSETMELEIVQLGHCLSRTRQAPFVSDSLYTFVHAAQKVLGSKGSLHTLYMK